MLVDKTHKGTMLGVELSEEARREVLEDLFVFGKENQRPFLNRMAILLFLSTVIACCGLLSNSPAVVIGAMLIAPLMRPVMSAAGAITMGWPDRLYSSLLLALAMAVAAVVISIGITLLAPDMVDIPAQVMDRTRPTFFDLVIALAAGAAGAYTMTRKESSAIPGVAMAVSLLPPLASCGILLVFLENELALRAFILFVTNFSAMILAGTTVFVLSGVSSASEREQAAMFVRTFLLISLLLVAGISVPLYYYSASVWYDDKYEAAKSELLQTWLQDNDLRLLNMEINEKNREIHLALTGRNAPLSLEELHQRVKESLQREGMDVDFTILSSWTRSVINSWPPPPASELDPGKFVEAALAEITILKSTVWGWTRTQYSGQLWNGNDNTQEYTVTFLEEEKLRFKISCKELDSTYHVSPGWLKFEIELSLSSSCDNNELDALFINDLNRVVDYRVHDEMLVLELGGGAGAMFFTPLGSPSEQ